MKLRDKILSAELFCYLRTDYFLSNLLEEDFICYLLTNKKLLVKQLNFLFRCLTENIK